MRVRALIVVVLFAGVSGAVVEHLTAQPIQAQELSPEERYLEGLDNLTRGLYRSAARHGKSLAKVDGHREQGLWLEARVGREDGDPNKVVKNLKSEDIATFSSALLLAEYGYACLDTGRYDDAETIGRQLEQSFKTDPRGSYILGEAQWLKGEREAGRRALETAHRGAAAVTPDRNQQPDFESAEKSYAGGLAALRLDQLRNAKMRFEDATFFYEQHTPSLLGLARVFTETDKPEEANRNYAEKVVGGVAIAGYNPNSSDGHLSRALNSQAQWKSDVTRRALDQSIRANRYNDVARAHRALYFIDVDQFQEAEKDLERALKVNSRRLLTNAVQAIYHLDRLEQEQFEAVRDRVISANPNAAEFFEHIANYLASTLRFSEAEVFYRKALGLDPKRWTLHKGLGQALMYMGRTKEGAEYFETALNNDPLRNSLTTRNQLLLLQRMERYQEHKLLEGKVILRLHEDDAPVLVPLYRAYVERDVKAIQEKYQFEPNWPIYIESFYRTDEFETRTIGFPGLPALGACFGSLVTLKSPRVSYQSADSSGDVEPDFNWASTLRHELDHVFQLQMSSGLCPRWLAEGCSVHEESRARPEWERHMEGQLYQLHAAGEIPSVRGFEEWFGGPRVLFAYYLASVMVRHMIEDLGGQRVVTRMLHAYGEGKTIEEVFQDALGMSTKAFDASFEKYVRELIGQIKLMPAVEVDAMVDLQERAEDGEASTDELVLLARAHAQRGSFPDARIWAGMAEKRGAASKELSFVKGLLAQSDPRYLRPEQQERAKKYLAEAINGGLEDFNLYMALARIASEQREQDALIFYINLARRAFPTNPAPLRTLLQFYLGEGDDLRAQKISEQYALLVEDDLTVRLWLLERYVSMGADLRVVEMAEQIVNIDPYVSTSYRQRAKSLTKLGRFTEALSAWRQLGQLASEQTTPQWKAEFEIEAYLGQASTLLEAGDPDAAEDVAERARAVDPDHPMVREYFNDREAAEAVQRF